ncbi:MAG: hypothetical protein DDG60_10940, partial [Anaerolineae bacterium]
MQVVGWDRSEITARADSDSLTLTVEPGHARATSDSDLIVYIPSQTALQIHKVGGDADIRAVFGAIEIAQVGGDVQMRKTGPTRVIALGGDLSARDVAGHLVAEAVGGDVSLHHIGGDVRVETGADFYLREAEGNISAQVGADAALYLHPTAGQSVHIQAGGDILLRVPADVNARFTLQGSDEQDIRVDLPDVESAERSDLRQFVVGTSDCEIHLIAGGEVIVTSREEAWQSVADFDRLGRAWWGSSGDWVETSRGLQEQIAQQTEEITRRAMQASLRAQAHSERIQQRVEAAMRRAEEKMRSAERRSAHMGISMGKWGGAPPA